MAKFLDGSNNGLGYLWNRIKLLINNKMEKDGSNASNVVTMPSDKLSVESDEVDESWVDSGVGIILNDSSVKCITGPEILTKNNDGGTGLATLDVTPYLLTSDQNTKHFGLRFPLTVGATAWSVYTSYRGKFRIKLQNSLSNMQNLYITNGDQSGDYFSTFNLKLFNDSGSPYDFQDPTTSDGPQKIFPDNTYINRPQSKYIQKINKTWYYIGFEYLSTSGSSDSYKLTFYKYDKDQNEWITLASQTAITDADTNNTPSMSTCTYSNTELLVFIQYYPTGATADHKVICKKLTLSTNVIANVTFPITTNTIRQPLVQPFYAKYNKTLYITFTTNDNTCKFYKYNGSNAFTAITYTISGDNYRFPGWSPSSSSANLKQQRFLFKDNFVYGLNEYAYSTTVSGTLRNYSNLYITKLNLDTNNFEFIKTFSSYTTSSSTLPNKVRWTLEVYTYNPCFLSKDGLYFFISGIYYSSSKYLLYMYKYDLLSEETSPTVIINGKNFTSLQYYNTPRFIYYEDDLENEDLLASVDITDPILSYLDNSDKEYDSDSGEYILKDVKIGNLTSSFFADGETSPEAKSINNQNYYITHLLTDGHKGLNIRCKKLTLTPYQVVYQYYLDFEFDFHSKIAKAANTVIWQANKYWYLSLLGYDPTNDTADGSQEFKIYVRNKLLSNPNTIAALSTDARTDKIVMGSPLGSFTGNLIFGSRNMANANGQILLGNDAIPDINDIFALGTNDPQIRDKILSIDKMGNIWSNGYTPWFHGRCNGVLLQDSPYWFPLEDGAVYMINIIGKANNNNAWRGYHSYAIACTWDSTKNVAQTTAQGVGRWVSITLGANGSAAYSWVCYAIPYVYTDPGTGTTYQKYRSGIGIGSCATNIDMRFSIIKIMGSVEDF